jgi:hypothetical protein
MVAAERGDLPTGKEMHGGLIETGVSVDARDKNSRTKISGRRSLSSNVSSGFFRAALG